MLYVIAEQLGFPGILNLIRYISFRAGAASATALIIGLMLGPWFISWLRATQGKGQPIRADGPQSHLAKRGTPTMGGLLILISVSISVLLCNDNVAPDGTKRQLFGPNPKGLLILAANGQFAQIMVRAVDQLQSEQSWRAQQRKTRRQYKELPLRLAPGRPMRRAKR